MPGEAASILYAQVDHFETSQNKIRTAMLAFVTYDCPARDASTVFCTHGRGRDTGQSIWSANVAAS